MSTTPTRMHLALFLGRIGGAGAWRLEGSPAESLWDLDFYLAAAQAAEAAKFDAVFRADNPFVDLDRLPFAPAGALDAVVLMGALAARTQRIGIVATASSTFSDPYTVARQFATIDHISGGRAGWNLVASERGEGNFGGVVLTDRARKHERSAEFASVVAALWDSWDADALDVDRAAGRFARPGAVRAIDHSGAHFQVQGPLDVARSPQGHPVVCTTATSPQAMAVAARHADVVYSASSSLEGARADYQRLKSMVADAGRDPRDVKVLLAVSPLVAETDAAAAELRDTLDGFTDLEASMRNLEHIFAVSFDALALDEVLPEEFLRGVLEAEVVHPTAARLASLALAERFTLRKLLVFGAGANVPIWEPQGSVERIADELETWFRAGACDGFNINPAYTPAGITLMTEGVAPLLAARGLFRDEYEHATLRGHLGLSAL